ncbi:MAG: hypothetical protein J0L93_06590 [Deltaproteobacteria bacterium]|nr:hypothetical protein [Deltaproteobacteria bacterium]
MDDNNRNYGQSNYGQNNQNRDRNRDGGRRFRQGGGRPMHHGHRGRTQRPLLTSALNGAVLSLVALVVLGRQEHTQSYQLLGAAIASFGISAFVSYAAQRTKSEWIEKVSDLFFFIGLGIIVWVGVHLSGILPL